MGITSKIIQSVPNRSVAETPLGIVGDITVLTDIILEVTTKITEVLDLVKEKPYPFSEGQNIYQASGIRQEFFASLNSEQLRNFLEKLDKDLVEFYQSFEKQKKQLTEQEWFKIIDQQTDLLQEQKVEAQIQVNSNPK
nr:13421_t:CDS:2 [Entrophospora candida]